MGMLALLAKLISGFGLRLPELAASETDLGRCFREVCRLS